MKRLLLLSLLCLGVSPGWAQIDSTRALNEVVISGIQPSSPRATSIHIESHSLKQLNAASPYNLSDALAKLPGFSQLSTGNAISKPVLRGLFGNRILILFSGLRFDNQQFQDEHGLGISQIGIDRVEVIRGPASLLYGTDAVGGVINVIEEGKDTYLPGKTLDANLRYYSNTMGTLSDAGMMLARKRDWFRLRLGYENHADYTDGDGQRVYDSRNTGYYLKAGYGFRKAHWTSDNSFNSSFNQYGFILDSLNHYRKQDARWSRGTGGPHHNVLLNILSSQNTFQLHRSSDSTTEPRQGSVLKLNAGFQSNKRAEDEGGGKISLNMHLLSILQSARWEKYVTRHTLLVLNEQATYENNTNYGKRTIIPDANMWEGNLSGFIRHTSGLLVMETGAGLSYKRIQTLLTGKLNTPDKQIHPFTSEQPAVNAMLGLSYNPTRHLNVKANIATGVRSGNLAELASEGLHEGSYRYELGDPTLKPEQNINTDICLELDREQFFLSISGFYNRFANYIYLQPTTDSFNGIFQIYRYIQQDAYLYGGELSAIYKPRSGWQLKEVFSSVEGTTTAGQYLPFIPAWRSVTSLRFARDLSSRWQDSYIEPELEYALAQNHPNQFETTTPDYGLLHLNSGISMYVDKHRISFQLSIRNLLNKTYTDHLSRLKYFGYNNQGLNVVFSVGVRSAR